jgi:hypothetical protein
MNKHLTNKNEKSSLTYEELMNSHFLKYPTHSRIVYVIFNPFIVTAIILVATTMYVKIVDGDWGYALMVGMICSMFLSMKMAMVAIQMNGHGVGMIKKRKLSVLGLPSAAVVMYAIILSLLTTITVLGYTAPGGGFERVQQLGVCMLFGFVMSVLSWRLHSYYTTWYGSEYDARMEFKNKGYSDEVVAEKLQKLKKMGVLL